MSDPFRLQRFLDAQARVYGNVVLELRAGQKRTHWMWFVFPQIAGLGLSPTSVFYAIASLDEARAFSGHPVLGARLQECAALALAVEGRTARQIFGEIDARKFQSSMTLFSAARPEEGVFAACLEKFYGGERDAATMERI
jgi:uncharacterized protein (DUF1810 family)